MPYLKEESMKSPIELLRSLLTDVRRLEPDVKGLDRDVITIEKRFKDEGYGFLTVALPALCDALDRGLADGQFACPSGFARIRGGTIPRLFSGMFCKVFVAESGNLNESPHESIVKCLREVLRLFKKLSLESDREETLDLEAKRGFFEMDDRANSEIELSETQSYILDRVSRYILPNIDTFDERELPLKHGPGAVVESLSANQKWLAVTRYSPRLEELGYDITYFREEGHGVIVDSSNLSPYGASGDIAKLISVPKNSTSRRTITIEPVIRQFVQQGFNMLLRDNIVSCGLLRRCLALTDQSKNQHLALIGSRTGYWSTIDLKSASDLLSVKIVSRVFRYRPRLLQGLIDCRSAAVRTSKTERTIAKYAGMGNATTFPVQSIVFATLAISALLEGYHLEPSYRNAKRVSRYVRVYGDDIIVPSEHARLVMDWLSRVGLIVNAKKSFTVGNFRESCGVDAYRGVDVTPVYVRYRPDQLSKKDPSTIAHYVSLSNQAWMRGLYAMSTLLKDMVEKTLRRGLPLVSSHSGLLGLHTRLEAQEFHRWNPVLQRPETNGFTLIPLKRKDELDGYAALLKFFHVPLEGRDRGHLQKSPVRFKNRIVRRWVPA
jgi:hypothetical protein